MKLEEIEFEKEYKVKMTGIIGKAFGKATYAFEADKVGLVFVIEGKPVYDWFEASTVENI